MDCLTNLLKMKFHQTKSQQINNRKTAENRFDETTP